MLAAGRQSTLRQSDTSGQIRNVARIAHARHSKRTLFIHFFSSHRWEYLSRVENTYLAPHLSDAKHLGALLDISPRWQAVMFYSACQVGQVILSKLFGLLSFMWSTVRARSQDLVVLIQKSRKCGSAMTVLRKYRRVDTARGTWGNFGLLYLFEMGDCQWWEVNKYKYFVTLL